MRWKHRLLEVMADEADISPSDFTLMFREMNYKE